MASFRQRLANMLTPRANDALGESNLLALETKSTYYGYDGTALGYLGGGFSGRSGELTFDKFGAAAAYSRVPVVNRAVNLIADALDSLPFRIVFNPTNDPANDKTLAESTDPRPRHVFMRAMRRAHLRQKQSLIWLSAFSLLNYGENFIEPLPDVFGTRYVGMNWLNPLAVQIIVAGGCISYFNYTYPGNGGAVTFNPNEVVYDHTRNPNDDFAGLSKTIVAMNKINLLRDMDRFLGDYFSNNAVPDLVVSPKGESTFSPVDTELLQDQIRNNLKGSGNQHRVYISPKAADWTALQQSDLSKQYSVNDPITRQVFYTFGIPLSMAGDDAGTQYKAGDPIRIAFYQNTIIPFARDMETFINLELMPRFDPSGNERFEFDTSAYDTASEDDLLRSQVATTNYQSGLWTKNEGRTYTGKEPDAEGDSYVAPAAPMFGGSSDTPPPVVNSDHIDTDLVSSELRAWRKHAHNRGAKKSAGTFECKHVKTSIARFIAYELMELGNEASKAQINALFDDVDLLRGVKAYSDTRDSFMRQITDIIEAARVNEINRRRFGNDMRTLCRRSGLDSVFNAYEDADNPIESIPDDMLTIFRVWQAQTSDYITNFGNELFKAGITDAEVEVRKQMWSNKTLDDIYYAALREAGKTIDATWFLGNTTDHCDSCVARNGKTMTVDEWGKIGFPRDSRLDCGGWLCDCSIRSKSGKVLGAR